MKKNILTTTLLIATFLFSLTSFAQEDTRSKVAFGIKVGANYANIWDTEAKDFSAQGRIGLAAGAFVSIPLGNILAIQPEIMFSQKGFKSTGELFGLKYEASRTSNFVDVPLMVNIRPTPWLGIVAGPQLSFLLSQKTRLTVGEFSTEEENDFKNKDFNIRKFTVGAHAGFDFYIKNFVISPRVALDFLDNKGDGTSENPNYKNIIGQLTFGYKF